MEPKLTTELVQKIEQAYAFIQSLRASTTIPSDVDGAIRDRFGLDFQGSDKTAASETVTIDTSVPGTTSVARPMDGFILIDGKNVPYYN